MEASLSALDVPVVGRVHLHPQGAGGRRDEQGEVRIDRLACGEDQVVGRRRTEPGQRRPHRVVARRQAHHYAVTQDRFLRRRVSTSILQRDCPTSCLLPIDEILTAPRSPWQNPFVERVIGSLRRECLDHVIVWNERSLRRHVQQYLAYYDAARIHLARAVALPHGFFAIDDEDPSTESEWVATCLEALGHEAVVADPNDAAMYGTRTRRIKTDRRDVAALAEANRTGIYRPAARVSPTQRAIRQRR